MAEEYNIESLDSHTSYKEALYFIVTLLLPNMEHYLEEEGRYYGRVKSYMDSMKLAKSQGDEKINESDKIHYGKILSVIRTQIKKDFNRLGNRKMSCADRIIIMSRWILKIADFIPKDDYKFQRELTTFSRVLEHMYDNIRNHSKKDNFHVLTKLIERAINNGEYSEKSLLSIDLINEGLRKTRDDDNKRKKKLIIKTEKAILKEDQKLMKEIDFNKEEEGE